MTTAPVATWILSLEQSAHVVEYLIVIWPGGKIEFEDSYSMDSFHPREYITLDDRAVFLQEFEVEKQGDEAEVLSRYTRKISLSPHLVKQILRAKRRGFYRDHSKLPYDDPRRTRLDLLATVIEKALEKLFWADWVKFMMLVPERRTDLSVPQTRRPPDNTEINCPSNAVSQKRF